MMEFHREAFGCYSAVLALQISHAGALTAIGHLFQKEGMLNEAVEARYLRARRSQFPNSVCRETL